jgi:hypothetical protein
MTSPIRCLVPATAAIALLSVSAAGADEPAKPDAARVVINSFHVGNSLTGNAVRFRDFAKTAGIENRSSWFLIGGAYTVKLWRAKEHRLRAGEIAPSSAVALCGMGRT